MLRLGHPSDRPVKRFKSGRPAQPSPQIDRQRIRAALHRSRCVAEGLEIQIRRAEFDVDLTRRQMIVIRQHQRPTEAVGIHPAPIEKSEVLVGAECNQVSRQRGVGRDLRDRRVQDRTQV